MAALPGSRAAALVGVHRLETVAVFRFLFDDKKEQLNGKMPSAKKQGVCHHTNRLTASSNTSSPTLQTVNQKKYRGRLSGYCLATSL